MVCPSCPPSQSLGFSSAEGATLGTEQDLGLVQCALECLTVDENLAYTQGDRHSSQYFRQGQHPPSLILQVPQTGAVDSGMKPTQAFPRGVPSHRLVGRQEETVTVLRTLPRGGDKEPGSGSRVRAA